MQIEHRLAEREAIYIQPVDENGVVQDDISGQLRFFFDDSCYMLDGEWDEGSLRFDIHEVGLTTYPNGQPKTYQASLYAIDETRPTFLTTLEINVIGGC